MMESKTVKSLIIGNWHFWEANCSILASNETLKRFYQFNNFDNACNWLVGHNLGLAREFYKQWRNL